mgnify:CR=1 FL=1
MLFNSLDFAVFLPIVFALYWFVTNHNLKLQKALIVAASYVFYGWWDWRFLSLIIFSTLVDYSIGRRLKNEEKQSTRKILLWTSIIVNLGFLGFFKYYNFFLDNFVAAFSFFGQEIQSNTLNIILPVGISFYTFQTLSYTIDVYKKNLEPTEDFIAFSAFVCFFPQLVAGPIERATNLLPQFYKKRFLTYSKEASWLIITGLLRKMVFADNFGYFVDIVWSSAINSNIFTFILSSLFFTIQIWFDFSGYSRIARGVALLFGFRLMLNFNYPYQAKSLKEFWSRWHISLSTWFKDYLYIPLGGSKRGPLWTLLNLFIVFLVSGVWHGAGWNFILWGALHGIFIVIERFFKIHLGKTITILVVILAWIPFRAPDLTTMLIYGQGIAQMPNHIGDLHAGIGPIFLGFNIILFLLLFVYLNLEKRMSDWIYFIAPIALFFLSYSSKTFIYFQF